MQRPSKLPNFRFKGQVQLPMQEFVTRVKLEWQEVEFYIEDGRKERI